MKRSKTPFGNFQMFYKALKNHDIEIDSVPKNPLFYLSSRRNKIDVYTLEEKYFYRFDENYII